MAVTFNGTAANHYTYVGTVVALTYPLFVGGFYKPANTTNPEGTLFRHGTITGSDTMFAVEQMTDGLVAIVGATSVYNWSTKSGLVAGTTVAFLARFVSDSYRDIAINTSFSTPDTVTRNALSVAHGLVTVGAYSNDNSSYGNSLNGDLSHLFVGQGFIANDEWIDFVNGRRDINRLRGGGVRGLWHFLSNGNQQNSASNPAYVLTQAGTVPAATHPTVPTFTSDGTPAVLVKNQRWMTLDGLTGMALSGYGTWPTIYDYSPTSFAAITATDYISLLDDIKAKNCNYLRTFASDYSRNAGVFNTNDFFAPLPWARSATAGHADGGNKFDLTTFDAAYFTRMRAVLQAALDRNIYVSIMLFEGLNNRFPVTAWVVSGHPFAAGNNVNSIDADANASGRVEEAYTLANASITAIQEAYIRKVIDETHDFPNALYEPANEANFSQATHDWQQHVADYIRSYQRTKPANYRNLIIRSPSGISDNDSAAVQYGPGDITVPSSAWPGYSIAPSPTIPAVGFDNHPRIWDSDHQGSANVVYGDFAKALLTGHHLHMMDDFYPIDAAAPANVTTIRMLLGKLLSCTKRMDLANVLVKPTLASTGYCLAKVGSEYLVYQPGSGSFTVNLPEIAGCICNVRWLNTNNGNEVTGQVLSQDVTTFQHPFDSGTSGVILFLTSRTESVRSQPVSIQQRVA